MISLLERFSERQPQKAFKQTTPKQTAKELITHVEGNLTAAKMAKILEVLNDGRWHTLEEVQLKTGLDKKRMQRVTAFLKEFDFITTDAAEKEIMLTEAVREFLLRDPTG